MSETDQDNPLGLNDYEPATMRVGLLQPRRTMVAVMPRADYVAIAEEVIEECQESIGIEDHIAAGLMETARTADRFAMAAWISPDRGCGCLVGEFLIALNEVEDYSDAVNDELEARRGAAEVYGGQSIETVHSRIEGRYGTDTAASLIRVGKRMDERMRDRLKEYDIDLDTGTVFIRD
jgi:hypothetical protein